MWIRRSMHGVYTGFGHLKGSCNGHKRLCTSLAAGACVPALPPASRLTVQAAVALWAKHFQERGVSEPTLSSQYIVAHLLGAKTLESLGQNRVTEFLTREQTEHMWELCTRRLSRMPVQYVIEEWDFRDLTLKMRPPVFIPRPETEELVGLVLTDLQMNQRTGVRGEPGFRCLEVGCGSGAISLSLLNCLPELRAIALDKSQDAVCLTSENADSLGLRDRLEVHHMDVMRDADAIVSMCSPVSALVSNPPYLFSEDMTTLEPEILRFEDHAALDGGSDGMLVIRQILTLAPKLLSNHGRVYLEVDPRHPPLIQRWVEDNVEGLHYVCTQHDITDRPRFCILQKGTCSATAHEKDEG